MLSVAVIHQVTLIIAVIRTVCFWLLPVVAQWTAALIPLLHGTDCPANTRRSIVIGPTLVVYSVLHQANSLLLVAQSEWTCEIVAHKYCYFWC